MADAEGWYRHLRDERIEIYCRDPDTDTTMRYTGPSKTSRAFVVMFQEATGKRVTDPERKNPLFTDDPIPGQTNMEV